MNTITETGRLTEAETGVADEPAGHSIGRDG